MRKSAVPTSEHDPPGGAAQRASSPGRALCAYTMGELDVAEAALGNTDLHEGVHRARKAIRRARAALALGDGILGPGEKLLDRELRALNKGLSPLRDAHALVETLDRLLDRKLDEDTRALLQRGREAAIDARSICTERELQRDPGLSQRRALAKVLQTALPALAWERITPSALRIAVADSDARMQRAREKANRKARDEDWHRWRRRARRASQQRRALEAVDVTVSTAPDTFDKRSTERLGKAQDLTLLLAHCGPDSPFSKDDRKDLQNYAEPALQRLRRRIAAARR